MCYLPPADSTRNVDVHEFYDTLLSQIHTYGTNSLFFMCGDFNSRCSDMEDFIPGVDDIVERNVIDFSANAYGEILCEFLINANCCILNGRNTLRNNYTYVSTQGSSVVDYCLVPYECLEMFSGFEVITMNELIQKHNLADYVDLSVSKPDHSILTWNINIAKSVDIKDHEYEKDVSSFKKFNLSNIPNAFLESRLRDIEDIILSLELQNLTNNDIDNAYIHFVELLKDEMGKCLESKIVNVSHGFNNKKRRIKKPWWSDKLSGLWNDMCVAEKKMLRCVSLAEKRELRKVFTSKRKLFDQETQRLKRNYWRSKVSEIR